MNNPGKREFKTDELLIEAARKEDAEALLSLQLLAYQSEAILYQNWNIPPLVEPLETVRAAFDAALFLKATYGESHRLVGSVRTRVEAGTGYVGRLFVHPDFQGRGIGASLLRAVEQGLPQVRRFELFTGNQSTRNLSLYQRMGYVPFREERLSDEVALVFLEKILA